MKDKLIEFKIGDGWIKFAQNWETKDKTRIQVSLSVIIKTIMPELREASEGFEFPLNPVVERFLDYLKYRNERH